MTVVASPVPLPSGNVSVNNSGGFASVRTVNFEPALNGAPYEGLELRLKVREGLGHTVRMGALLLYALGFEIPGWARGVSVTVD